MLTITSPASRHHWHLREGLITFNSRHMQHHLLLSHWSDSPFHCPAILHRHPTEVQSHQLFAPYALVIWFTIQTYAFVTHYDMPICPRTKAAEPQWYPCEPSVTDILPHKVTVRWKLFYLKIERKNNLNFLLILNTSLLLNDLQRRNLSKMHAFHGTTYFFTAFPISY